MYLRIKQRINISLILQYNKQLQKTADKIRQCTLTREKYDIHFDNTYQTLYITYKHNQTYYCANTRRTPHPHAHAYKICTTHISDDTLHQTGKTC